MLRRLVLACALALSVVASAAAEDPAYLRANARLARTIPHYPRARLLVEEPVGGEVGPVPFEAVQRVYALARPATQRAAIGFYRLKLGTKWRRRGATCLVSRSRAVVVLVVPKRRRLGVLVDSRGAARCNGLTGLLGDFLGAGYPNAEM
jgi:hypothetical protein